jgi:hypothetical protein
MLRAGASIVVDAWGRWTGERGEPRTEEQIRAAWAGEPAAFRGFARQTDATGADAAAKAGEGCSPSRACAMTGMCAHTKVGNAGEPM